MASQHVGRLVKVTDESHPRCGDQAVIVVDDRSSAPFKLLFRDGVSELGNWFSPQQIKFVRRADAQATARLITEEDARRRIDNIAKFAQSSSRGGAARTPAATPSTAGAGAGAGASTVSAPPANIVPKNTPGSSAYFGPSRPLREEEVEARMQAIQQHFNSETELNLAREVIRHGATIKAFPFTRPDGIRGIHSPTPLRAGDTILAIPKKYIMHFDVARASVKTAIEAELAESSYANSSMQREVFQKMMALCIELMLERTILKHTGPRAQDDRAPDPSFWRGYVESLPAPPDTLNRYTQSDKALYVAVLEQDLTKMYVPLLDIIEGAVHRVKDFQTYGAEPPSGTQIQNEFFFILSRLSYLRLIPYVDLANAALPGEHNVKIQVDESTGNVTLHALRDIPAGEELCIDYNHRTGCSLMASYGFSNGLELTTSSFVVPASPRPFIYA